MPQHGMHINDTVNVHVCHQMPVGCGQSCGLGWGYDTLDNTLRLLINVHDICHGICTGLCHLQIKCYQKSSYLDVLKVFSTGNNNSNNILFCPLDALLKVEEGREGLQRCLPLKGSKQHWVSEWEKNENFSLKG